MTKLTQEQKQLQAGSVSIGAIIGVITIATTVVSIGINIANSVKASKQAAKAPPKPERILYNCTNYITRRTLH